MFLRHIVRRLTFGLVVLSVTAGFSVFAAERLDAQGASGDTGTTRGGRGGAGRGGMPRAGADRPMPDQFQDRFVKVLRERIALTDDQITKWRAWNQKFDPERRALWAEERQLRRVFVEELARGVTPNEAKLTEALDRWPVLQQKRLALVERENKELATFLKPVQRARFFALQDDVTRGFQETQGRRDGRGDGGRDAGRSGPPKSGDTTGTKFRPGTRGDSVRTKPPAAVRPAPEADALTDSLFRY